MTEAIVCEALSKSFGDTRAVVGLDLAVAEGEVFGLVGPDGAGKSTTIRMLTTILAPDSGNARIFGHDVVAERRSLRGLVGYMSQQFNLYGDLTVAENLAFFADLYGVKGALRERRLKELLDFSRLGPFLDRQAQHLSGGMKQKLALSCNLIHEPKILFLDEPTTGVDPISRRDFWQILSELHANGTTLFISTPYMDEAERCDRVGFIDSGKLTTVATPAELVSRLGGTLLEVAAEPLRAARDVIAQLPSVQGVELFGDRLQVSATDLPAATEAIRAALASAGMSVERVGEVSPSMESAFVELVKEGSK